MNKKSDVALAVAACVCVVLMCVRAVSVFHRGPYVYTTGYEHESLFAIWEWINKKAVYGNPFQPPFAQSYYNWLFYWVYGAVGSLTLSIAKLDSAALPVICRSLTLTLTLVSMLVVYHILNPLSFWRRIAGSAVVAFNPLVGLWALSTRSDVGALTCSLIGAWCIGNFNRSRSLVWIGMAFLAFYCAWAFKQVYIAGFAATVLYLWLSRRRKAALSFGGATVLAIGLTFMLGTPEYRYAAISSQSHMALFFSIAVHVFGFAIVKAPALLIALPLVITCVRRDRANFFALWAIISLPLMFIASGKQGAADNYFFEPATACIILLLLKERHLTTLAVAQIVAPILICSGFSNRPFGWQEPELALLKSGLAGMNGSVIVTTTEGNMPWIQTREPHFVLATTYWWDRASGMAFAFGGAAGMIRSGQIDFLVCPRGEVDISFDGIIPSSLRKVKEDSRWVYFATHAMR